MTFEEAYIQYQKYIEVRQKSQSIRSIKEKFKNHIIPYFQNYKINDIKESDYLEFQSQIENKNLSYNTKRNIHFMLSGFMNYCVTYLELSYNTVSKVGCFKRKNERTKEQKYYSYQEFKQFIKYIEENIYKQFFILMFYTGTRPGEAMALKFSDIKGCSIDINKTIDQHGKREIGTPKSMSSYRIISINKKLYKNLMKLKKYYQDNYQDVNYDYFIFGGKKPLSPTSINRRKKIACEKAKIKVIRLHDFRHSHATLLNNHKIGVKEISSRLGHNDISITLKTYIHSNKLQEKKVNKTLFFLSLF